MKASEAVRAGTSALESAGVDSPRLDAELLVCHVLGWDRTRLYTYPEFLLSQEAEQQWRALLRRRVNREPLPYLLTEWEFYGRKFIVNPSVLIPRPETELLVEGLLRRLPWNADGLPLFMDVGTGSGCIAVTLAAEEPGAIGMMLDRSAAALGIAERNAERWGVRDRLEPRHSLFPHGLDDFAGRLDVLASNPPYVAERERDILPPEVREYEPHEALYAGLDGLDLLRQLLEHGLQLLKPQGWIALEFGIGQAEALHELADRWGYGLISIEDDLAGIPRALFARAPS